MTILYYLHQFPAFGGIEVVTATLANEFVLQGHSVIIISHISAQNDCRALNLDKRVQVLKMPNETFRTHANRAFLQKIISEKDIDAVIFQDSYAPIESNLLPCCRKVPIIICEHNSPWSPYERIPSWNNPVHEIIARIVFPIKQLVHNRFERIRRRYLYSHSTRYILLSTRFYGEFRSVTRLTDCRKLLAINNPIAPGIARPLRRKNQTVVFAATLDGRKGCDMLLRIWKALGGNTIGWRLLILGDGPCRPELKAYAEINGLANVEFLGYQGDPGQYFESADIFVMTSRREGWGLSLVEAMANGCVPIVFDSYAAVRDIVTDGYDGFVIPAFDTKCYANCLKRLMGDEDLRSSISKRAMEGSKRFSVERIATIWLQMINSVRTE